MIPADLGARLRELVQASVQPLAPVTPIESDLPQGDLRKAFTALIQQALPDGTFKALVAGRTVTLALPHAAADGDVLELVTTGSNGRGTVFARLADAAPNESQPRPQLSQAGQLISQLLTGRHTDGSGTQLTRQGPLINVSPGQTAAAPAQTALDKAAVIINQSANQPIDTKAAMAATTAAADPRATGQAAPGVAHNSSATSSAAAQSAAAAQKMAFAAALPTHQLAAQLAPILRNIVSQSGLFYEAQLSRWVDGELPLDSLLEQPQAQAGRAANAAAPNAGNTPNSAPPLRAALMGDDQPALREAAATAARQGEEMRGNSATAASRSEPGVLKMPEQMMPIVHQQLDALATQQAMWNAQVWPGQTMQWSIDDPRGQGGGEEEDAQIWRSNLRLELPNLGTIRAQLMLTPAGLALRIDAAQADSINTLQSHQHELDAALSAAGIPLTGMAVGHDENA